MKSLVNVFKLNKLKTQFSVISVLLLIIPVIISFAISYESYYSNIDKILNNTLDDSLTRSISWLNDYFYSVDNSVSMSFYNKNQQRLLGSNDKQEFYNNYEAVKSNFDFVVNLNPTVLSVQFINESGMVFSGSNVIDTVDVKNIISENENNVNFTGGKTIYVNNKSDDYLILIKKIKSTYSNYFDELGTAIIFLDRKQFIKYVDSNYTNDLKYRIVDCTGKEVIATVDLNLDNQRFISKSAPVELTDFTFIGYLSTDSLKQFNHVWFVTTFLTILSTIVFILIVLYIMNSFIMMPLNELSRACKDFGENRKLACPTKKFKFKNEVTNIIDVFNDMIKKNKKLSYHILKTQGELYEAELNKKQLELTSMQMQINSHFLYNTLSSIRGMLLKNNVREAIDGLGSFYSFLRYITIKGEKVTVEEEISHLKNYIDLQNTRKRKCIKLKIHVEEENLNLKILKLIMQPIVENSIVHGFAGKNLVSVIELNINKTENNFVIRIMDSGVGMNAEKLLLVRQKMKTSNMEDGSLALANIAGRLKLKYGKMCRMEIKSKEFVGTIVKFVIPCDGGNKNEQHIDS